jgi:APA family basic amino acid/polyamine antiporter
MATLTTLTRTLGFRDLTFLIVGSVIGSGIFIVPGAVLRQVDSYLVLALSVWLVGGILSLLGALTYGELSAMNPAAGGLYVYIRDCFGRFPAFLFGWTLFFVISSGTVATLAVAFSAYLGQVVSISAVEAKLVAIGMIVVVTAVNVWGTRKSSDLTNWATGIKVGAILLMAIILFSLGRGFAGASTPLWPPQLTGHLGSGFGVAMIAVLWAYEGWQYCTFTAGETVNPQRNFPRAFLIGSVVLIAIYMIANLAYLAALGAPAASQTDSIAATAVGAIVGPTAAKIIALVILVSIFSATNTNVLTAPRVYYSMASDGLFFKKLAEVHPRFGTPAIAIVVSSAWAAVMAASNTFEQLFTYVIFIGWIFYALGAASIFVYRKRDPETARQYKVPGYPWTPAVFILAAGGLVLNTIVAQPRNAAYGLAIAAVGVPVYPIWQWQGKRKTAVAGPGRA